MLTSPTNPQWILIGEIVTTQGNQGEVKVMPHTEFPERFQEMEQVRLFYPGSNEPTSEFPVENCRMHKGAIILKLTGVDSITAASKLVKMQIMVGEDELVTLPEGRHYVFQLIGLECITIGGQRIGTITDVLKTGANDVYVIQPYPGVTKQNEVLIPVIDHVVKKIDLDQSAVFIDLLDGLLD